MINISFGSKQISIPFPSSLEDFKKNCQRNFNLDDLFDFNVYLKYNEDNNFLIENENQYLQSLNYIKQKNLSPRFFIDEKLSKSIKGNIHEEENNKSNNINLSSYSSNNSNDLIEKYENDFPETQKKIDTLNTIDEFEGKENALNKNYKSQFKKEYSNNEEFDNLNNEKNKKINKEIEKYGLIVEKKMEELYKKELKSNKTEIEKNEENNIYNNNLLNKIYNNNNEENNLLEKKEINPRIKSNNENNSNQENSRIKSLNNFPKNYDNNFSNNISQILLTMKERCSNEFKNSITQYIEKEIKQLKNDLINKSFIKNEKVINNYFEKINKSEQERKIQFQTELNKITESKISMSVCNTIHIGIKCNNCNKNPIQGIRYKCLICKSFNLCDLCEELNSEQNFHNPNHDFLRMRYERKENNIPKENFTLFDDKIIDYNYRCLNENLLLEIEKGTKNTEFEILIQNISELSWDDKSVKFICDRNNSNITIEEEIKVPSLQIGQQTKVLLKYNNLEKLGEGDYKSIFKFCVNNNIYGEPLILYIKVIDKLRDTITFLRNTYMLDIQNYPDEKLKNLIIKYNYDINNIANELFENNLS